MLKDDIIKEEYNLQKTIERNKKILNILSKCIGIDSSYF